MCYRKDPDLGFLYGVDYAIWKPKKDFPSNSPSDEWRGFRKPMDIFNGFMDLVNEDRA